MSRQHPTLPSGDLPPASLPTTESTRSFWHSKPSPLLTGHRSTRNLPTTADVLIIGSGVTGASVAHHLLVDDDLGVRCDEQASSGRGLNVVMLEAREACWGATGRNGGHCQPILFEAPDDPSIGRFELANFAALQSMIDRESIPCEFVAQPGVRAIYTRRHLDETELALHHMQTTAPDLTRLMRLVTSRAELQELRIPTAVGALVTSVAGRLWPYKLVCHVLESLLTSTAFRGNGSFNLQTLTPVERLTPTSDGRWTVHTARGEVVARKVVLATNAYTSHLLPSFAKLIVPIRGQMSALLPPRSVAGEQRLQTSLGFLGDGLDDYLIQRPNETGGHLMFGGGRQEGPSVAVTDDSVLDAPTAAYLRRRLLDALGLPEGKESDAECRAVNEWTGIMGFSRDDRPWVGPVPISLLPPSAQNSQSLESSGVYMAAGFTGHGMPNTWLCGKAVALMAAGKLRNEMSDAGLTGQSEFGEACKAVGLPECYRLTEQRVQQALEGESVEARDRADMQRGGFGTGFDGKRRAERPPSGYA